MKIRNGFVSNSSSSSFIVKLNKAASEYTLTSFMEDYEIPDYAINHAKELLKDLKHLENKSTELDAYIYIDLEDVCLDSEAKGEISDKLYDYGRKLIFDKFQERIANHIFTVEYADDNGDFHAEMENEFMPTFKGTIEVISHH